MNPMLEPRIAVFPKGYMDELSKGEMSLFEWIEMAATLGADGIELYPLFLQSDDPSYLERVKQAADRHGLDIPMMCSSPDFTHPDRDYRHREIANMEKMIRIMADVGPEAFRSCRVLSGQQRAEVSREDGIRWTVECIQALLPYAERHQVHLVMENHYKDGFWTAPEFAQRSVIYLEIIGQIDSPWFGVNYDPSNAIVAGEDPLELLRHVSGRTVTMHASDRYLKPGYSLEDLQAHREEGYAFALEHGVIGRGMNDYDAIFRILREAGFRGWISVEDGVNGLEEMRQSVSFLRSKLSQHFPTRAEA